VTTTTKLVLRSRRTQTAAALGLLTVAAIWGSTFVVVKTATSAFPVLAFLTVRFGIASLALLPLAVGRGALTRREVAWGVGAGILFAGGYVFQTFALRLSDSGRVGFITGLYVILVPLLALLIHRYPLTRPIFFSGILALLGMAILGYTPGSNLLGDGLALACALSFAGQILVVERFPVGVIDTRRNAFFQALTVTLVASGLMLALVGGNSCAEGLFCDLIRPFAEPFPTHLPLDVLAVAAYTGVLATALALGVQVWAQKYLPPSEAAIIFAMEAPFAAIFGILFLRERITLPAVIGCALIFAAMIVATAKKRA